MIVKPFRGIRPSPEFADRIPSPPYDVITTDEARRMAAGDPYSFLHVIRPEIDLDADVSPYDDRVYARGRENFLRMIDQGSLVRDEKPAYYVYRLRTDDHVQTGVLGAAAIDDYLQDRIKKHEHTRPDKERDRARLIDTLSAFPGPLFLTYRGVPEMNKLIDGIVVGSPQVQLSVDGVEHSLWVVDDPAVCDRIGRLFEALPCSYVADGHHRTAAAATVCKRRIAALDGRRGTEPCNYVLAAHFPAEQVRILDYNRVVRDLRDASPEAFVAAVHEAGFDVAPDHASRRPPRRRSFGMYLAGRWYLLSARPEIAAAGDVLKGLDVAILDRNLLQPLLEIDDPRTNPRIDFVGGSRGMDELERRVDSGEWAVAFALYPTSLDEVMQVADTGDVMPPKSTWFEPKLRSGLVVQTLDGETL